MRWGVKLLPRCFSGLGPAREGRRERSAPGDSQILAVIFETTFVWPFPPPPPTQPLAVVPGRAGLWLK